MGFGTPSPKMRSIPTMRTEKNGEPGLTQVVLTVKAGCPAERELFTLLSAMQAPLLRLAPVEESLEDVFLRATMDEE